MSCNHILLRGPRRGQPCNKQVHRNNKCRQHYLREQNLNRRNNPFPIRRSMRLRNRRNRIENENFNIYPVELRRNLNKKKIKDCNLCHNKVKYGPKVILECECEYHLKCYLIIQNEEKCITCNDKVFKSDDDYPECSICMDLIKDDKYKTKCNHKFHRDCIDSWKKIGKNTCPLCRTNNI